MAALFTHTNRWAARPLWRWMADATSSLPVPDSPVISTRASVGATRAIRARSSSIAGLTPTSGSACPSASCRRRFSASVRDSSSAARRVVSTPSGVSGFSRNWNAPSLVARTASVRFALPLIMTTGRSGALRLSCSSVCRPSGPPGIIRSSNTASGVSRSTAAIAAVPLAASAVSKPSDCSSAPTILRMLVSSSTSRMRGLMGSPARWRTWPRRPSSPRPGSCRCGTRSSAAPAPAPGPCRPAWS